MADWSHPRGRCACLSEDDLGMLHEDFSERFAERPSWGTAGSTSFDEAVEAPFGVEFRE